MFSSGARASCTVAVAASVIYITGTLVSGTVQTVKGLPLMLSSIIHDVYCTLLGVVTPGPITEG